MTDLAVVLLLLTLNAAAPDRADAADSPRSAGPAKEDKGGKAASGDPLAHLKPHEERRYKVDMQDCAKEQGADRRLCERSVHSRAAAKSRRRGATP